MAKSKNQVGVQAKVNKKLLFTNMTLLLSSSGEPEEFASLFKDEEV